MSNKAQLNSNKGFNIFVCGSQKFEDPAFVFGMLNQAYEQSNGNISTIYTSKFSGSCEYARKWTEIRNQHLDENHKIKIVDYVFDTLLEEKNNFLYDEMEIPESAIKSSKFFKELISKLMEMNVHVVMPFPNREGDLGVTTKNIVRASELLLGKNRVFHCEKAYQLMKQQANQTELTPTTDQEKESNTLGFKNRHPNKR